MFGCSTNKATSELTDGAISTGAKTAVAVLADESVRFGEHTVNSSEQSDEWNNCDSSTADDNAILVRNGAESSLQNVEVRKTGNGTQDLFLGLNAAVAVIESAYLRLESCTIAANGFSAPGLFCSGDDSHIEIFDTHIVASGSQSPAVVCTDNAMITLEETYVTSEAEDTPLIATRGDGMITLKNCSTLFAGVQAVEIHEGQLTFMLFSNSLVGDIVLFSEDLVPVGLTLQLLEGSSFTGTVRSEHTTNIHIVLDADSCWNLTSDVRISTITAPDIQFSCIQSNGFNIYYNADHEVNDWLASQVFLLPGGGFLAPLI